MQAYHQEEQVKNVEVTRFTLQVIVLIELRNVILL
jgi:hypothetical protein